MQAHEINTEVDEQFRGCVKEDWLRDIVMRTLCLQQGVPAAELGLLITGDETVRSLNQEYRGVNESTDVLAFALAEETPDGEARAFVNPPDGLAHLGEVIVSYPRMVEQAREHGHSVEAEMALLVIHGVLHLLGYEHDTPVREGEMRALEKRVLSEVLAQT